MSPSHARPAAGSGTAAGLDETAGGVLKAFLEAEIDTLEAVLRSIEAEHEALRGGDAGAIEAAAQHKSRALGEHADQQRRRHDWMAQQSLAPTTPLTTLAADGDPGLQGAVLRLGELARACDGGNRRNGALIQRLQDRTRNALGVLRGSGDKGDVYSGSGGQEHGSDRRSLGKA